MTIYTVVGAVRVVVLDDSKPHLSSYVFLLYWWKGDTAAIQNQNREIARIKAD